MIENRNAAARAAVRAAFEALSVIPGREYFIESGVNDVFLWLQPRQVDSHFVQVGRHGVRSELDKLAKIAESLENELKLIHKPTYETLYDNGMRPYDIMNFCRQLSTTCRTLDISQLPTRIPRSKSAFVGQNVALTLAHYFNQVTGRPAKISTNPDDGVPYGKFLEFVIAVFKAAGVKDSPVSCARYAVRKKNEQQKLGIIPFDAKVMDP